MSVAMSKRMPAALGATLTMAVGMIIAWLAWYLPLAVRAEDMGLDREGPMLVLTIVTGGALGAGIGAALANHRIRYWQWLSGAGAAVALAVVVPLTMFRGATWMNREFEAINHQRETIAWCSTSILIFVPMFLSVFRSKPQVVDE